MSEMTVHHARPAMWSILIKTHSAQAQQYNPAGPWASTDKHKPVLYRGFQSSVTCCTARLFSACHPDVDFSHRLQHSSKFPSCACPCPACLLTRHGARYGRACSQRDWSLRGAEKMESGEAKYHMHAIGSCVAKRTCAKLTESCM